MRALVVAVVVAAGCAPHATLLAIDGFDASFDGARGHRRLLALVSPS